MAKKQKSKLLAMALCASVMTGIYASPVMAANVSIWQDTTDNKIDFGLDDGKNNSVPVIRFDYNGMTVYNGSGTWDVFGISRHDGDFYAANKHFRVAKDGSISLNPTSDANTNPTIKLDAASGAIKAATGKFNVDSYGNTEAANFTGTEFNVTGQNDEVVSYLRAGDLRINDFSSWNSSGLTVGDFKISKNNSNYIVELNQHGGGSVFKADGAAGTVEAAGVKFESNNITLADEATVDGVDVSEVAHNVDGIRRYNVRDGKGTTVTEDTLFVDGVSQRVYTRGDIYSSGDFVTVDENGEKYSLNNIGDKTAGISQHKWNTTYFEGAISATGSVSAGGVGDEAKIGGNTKDGGYLQLKDANDQYQKLTADKLATINTVITDEGEVNSRGDVTSMDGTNTYSLNAVGANTAGIDRTSNEKWSATTIEDTLIVKSNGSFQNADESFRVNANGAVKAAGGKFQIDKNGNVTNVGTVDGVDVSELSTAAKDISDLEDKTKYQYIAAENTTGFKGALNVEGNIRSAYGGFVVGDGSTSLHKGVLSLGADEGQKLTAEQLVNINNVIQEDGNVVANDITAADGAFKVREGVGETVIAGSVISSKDQFGNQGTFNGSYLNLQNADHTKNTSIDAGTAYFVNDGSGTSINGGAINAETLNGKNINDLVEGADIKEELANVAGIKRDDGTLPYGEGRTEIEGVVAINGKDGRFYVLGEDGTQAAVITNDGTARFGFEDEKHVCLEDGTLKINDANKATVASLSEDGLMLTDAESGEQTLTATKIADIEGITRDAETGTTTIEGATSFDTNGMNVGNGAVVANTDGSFSAANGAFSVDTKGNVSANKVTVGNTVLTGSSVTTDVISADEAQIGNTFIQNGIVNADNLFSANYNLEKVGTDLKNLTDDFETTSANVGGIERLDSDNDKKLDTTVIEKTLSVSEDEVSAVIGDSGFRINNNYVGLQYGLDTSIMLSGNGIDLNGTVNFTGHDGGRYTLSDLEGRVYDLEQKTEHITVDEAGNTTISSPNGDTTLTVTDEGVNIEGNGNVGGDATVSGNLDVEGTVTAPTGDFDKVTADEATVGNTHIGENGVETDKVTVTGTDGSVTTIDGGTITTGTTNIKGDSVYSENGYFDNLNSANGGTIGGVKLEGNTVDADKVVTGNTTLDNEGLNVGGQTSVTADGVNVGGNGGTTVDKEGVSIADSTIISDHDVVINDDNPDERVSLADVGNRVGNLEQGLSDLNSRVDKLDDRIDKVGAMAAAIANLRTMGYDPAAPTEVAVGLGQYRDETGAALGLFHYPNRDFMLSLSVSTSGDEVMGGIGATWKFGRKSPEKVAEIKKAQAEADVRRAEAQKLAKAEELKAAAKEAKIKAQMERHAKLAAERAAEAEAK